MLQHLIRGIVLLFVSSQMVNASEDKKEIVELVQKAEAYSEKNSNTEARHYKEAIERERVKEEQKQG